MQKKASHFVEHCAGHATLSKTSPLVQTSLKAKRDDYTSEKQDEKQNISCAFVSSFY